MKVKPEGKSGGYDINNFGCNYLVIITMKYIFTLLFMSLLISCHLISKKGREAQQMTLEWNNRSIVLPTDLPCKVLDRDTSISLLNNSKYKIFTYIDTTGCTACQFGALDWKQLIHEADSLNYDVDFLFYAHLKDYEEFETYLETNKFSHPVFYDYAGECNKKNNLPNQVIYQTFLLDENNKVLLIGKPKPDSKLWELYKKIISQ